MRDIAFIAAWAVLLPIALRGAELGVLLWTWTSLLAPNDVLFGLGAEVPFSKLAAGLTFALILCGRAGVRFRLDPTVLLLIALALTGFVSQTTALSAFPDLGWGLFDKFSKILLLAGAVTVLMPNRLRLHAMLLAICLGIGFTGVAECWKFLLSGGTHKVLGSQSTGDNNQVALDVLMTMPMLWYLHATAVRRPFRLVCLAGAAMLAVCVIATASRAGFVGLAGLGVAYALSRRRKLIGIAVVAAIGLIGSQLVSESWIARMNTIESADSDSSFVGRLGAWEVSVAVAEQRPFFGGGFHAIQQGDVWNAFHGEATRAQLFTDAPPEDYPRAAHSIYFEVLGDLGGVGLTLFLGLFALASLNAFRVWRLVRRSGRDDLAWAAQLAGALQVSILTFLVVGASLSAAYYDVDYLLVAMLAALRRHVAGALREEGVRPLGVRALA